MKDAAPLGLAWSMHDGTFREEECRQAWEQWRAPLTQWFTAHFPSYQPWAAWYFDDGQRGEHRKPPGVTTETSWQCARDLGVLNYNLPHVK